VIRRLGPGDEETLRELDRRFKEHVASPQAAAVFLCDQRHVALVAGGLDGFLLAYVLPRIDGRTGVFLYELEVAEHARRRGVGRALVHEARRIGHEAGAFEMYVLTEPDNDAANLFYESTGANSETAVMWSWELSRR
jgi:ribosomal protein S18 acetylase RimI-like enzyme